MSSEITNEPCTCRGAVAKAEQAGIGYEIVPAHYISQRCPNCGAIAPEHKDLETWKLQCSSCNRWWNLDVAAAMNVLARGKREWSTAEMKRIEENCGVKLLKKEGRGDHSKTED